MVYKMLEHEMFVISVLMITKLVIVYLTYLIKCAVKSYPVKGLNRILVYQVNWTAIQLKASQGSFPVESFPKSTGQGVVQLSSQPPEYSYTYIDISG